MKSSTDSLKILVVDDSRDVRDMILILLEKWGYRAAGANDGQSALDAILSFEPDVMLLDIGLPDMDGYEVFAEIQKKLPNHQIKIVALSGYGSAVDIEKSSAAGFYHHLVKPVIAKDLKAFLELIPPR